MTYLHHDMEDAMRAGLVNESDIPQNIQRVLGKTRQQRLDTLVMDLVTRTQQRLADNQAVILQSDKCETAMNQLRKWMFDHVYLHASQQRQRENVHRVLSGLFEYYLDHPNDISTAVPVEDSPPRRVLDHVSGMTDSYALSEFIRLLLPSSNHIEDNLL